MRAHRPDCGQVMVHVTGVSERKYRVRQSIDNVSVFEARAVRSGHFGASVDQGERQVGWSIDQRVV